MKLHYWKCVCRSLVCVYTGMYVWKGHCECKYCILSTIERIRFFFFLDSPFIGMSLFGGTTELAYQCSQQYPLATFCGPVPSDSAGFSLQCIEVRPFTKCIGHRGIVIRAEHFIYARSTANTKRCKTIYGWHEHCSPCNNSNSRQTSRLHVYFPYRLSYLVELCNGLY